MTSDQDVAGQFVDFKGEPWYKISNNQHLPEFFMSLASASDHWMFVSSRGALSAGRVNPDSAIFPYYSSDKLMDLADSTGSKTLLWVHQQGGRRTRWEPLTSKSQSDGLRSQNLYRNAYGNRILFEEIHHSLNLAFRYSWTCGQQLGFIRQCELINLGDAPVDITVTDGLVNLLPSQLGQDFQLRYSNLADAYKKSELQSESGLGVYYLSSIPTDRAEPSESLRATVAWQHGLDQPTIAISSEQWQRVRAGEPLENETDVRGRRGAYLVSKTVTVDPHQPKTWTIVADVNYDHCEVVQRNSQVSGKPSELILQDIQTSESELLQILSAADGCQVGAKPMRVWRHRSNVLFNVMRGGIPLDGYHVDADDFRRHVLAANRETYTTHQSLLEGCQNQDSPNEQLSIDQLQHSLESSGDPALIRIGNEYLPLCFSRRHGDPTRPWNKFSIDVVNDDGSKKLGYQGNWRDIFQNWEALSVSYPELTINMIFRFVNASTADGYNPYRITQDSFDWEVPDPDDPWANIGYWGDHQIVYLLRLLQACRSMTPAKLNKSLAKQVCSYADVPYRIRSYAEICRDPQVTIDFDEQKSSELDHRIQTIGQDGKLLFGTNGKPLSVSLLEKLLVPALTKLTNFVPGGGIWLNTQRPEWNDANNALVGRGLSMVTTYHLRQYLTFLIDWLGSETDSFSATAPISEDVWQLATRIQQSLIEHSEDFADANSGTDTIDDRQRKIILDKLSTAGSDYRQQIYDHGISGSATEVSLDEVVQLLQQARRMIDHTIRSNRRSDGMYHSYNLMHLSDETATISRLYEMLEGQVAVLNSGILSASEAVEVLDALRASKIYRSDQHSYMLYPDRQLPRFLEKNLIAPEQFQRSRLLNQLVRDGERSIVRQDIHGGVHFHGDFRNQADLDSALNQLESDAEYKTLVQEERDLLCEVFEETFGHRHFTGRSGTFFGYEGLGSIYWHMVSKLSLATIEQCIDSCDRDNMESTAVVSRLYDRYQEICDGIGPTKTPKQYGAFPFEPYSHTPSGAGVQQPGMTGQVKEDILARWHELGIRMRMGQLHFDPTFFQCCELLTSDSTLDFFDVQGQRIKFPVPAGCFGFTLCQTAIIYRQSESPELVIHYTDQASVRRQELCLTAKETQTLFSRSGQISSIEVSFAGRQ